MKVRTFLGLRLPADSAERIAKLYDAAHKRGELVPQAHEFAVRLAVKESMKVAQRVTRSVA